MRLLVIYETVGTKDCSLVTASPATVALGLADITLPADRPPLSSHERS